MLQKESAVVWYKRRAKSKKKTLKNSTECTKHSSHMHGLFQTGHAGSDPDDWEKRRKTRWMLTRFEVHHLSDKPVVSDGELGELQFVQAVDVSLALRPVIHNVLWGVTVWSERKKKWVSCFRGSTNKDLYVEPLLSKIQSSYSFPGPAYTPVHPWGTWSGPYHTPQSKWSYSKTA